MRELHAGLDLHSGNTYIGLIEKGTMKRVFEKRVRNNLDEVVWTLAPYREEIRGIAVESTFNWYCYVKCQGGKEQFGQGKNRER
jgi:transposase